MQCFIAKEQWRTSCALLGRKVEGGNCKTGQAPECKGDPAQCYMVKQHFLDRCSREAVENYGKDKADELQKELAKNGNPGKAIKDASDTVKLPTQLDESGFGWSRSCPVDGEIDLGRFGKHSYRADLFCDFANLAGHLFVLLTLLFSGRYILK